jgi:hypothetical protein
MSSRKHDDAHRPMGGRGQRGNRVGVPANWGGAVLVERNRCQHCGAVNDEHHKCDAAARGEEARALRAALEQIAKPGYGLELNDAIEEREHYWQQALLRCRETARAALNAVEDTPK